jgi:histidine triad (HIT) family protein
MSIYEPTTVDEKCIFCEIATGNFSTPGIFWEDAKFMAFLSIDPNTNGFSCVIPKQHYGSDVMKMPDNVLQEFIIASKKVAQILEDYYSDIGRVGVVMEGMGVDHAHIKLVPMHGTEYLKNGEWKQPLNTEDQWFDNYPGWISSAGGPMANMDDLKKLAENIKKSYE